MPPDAAFVHIHTDVAMADVTIEPGRAGPADAHIRVLREDFSEFPAKIGHDLRSTPPAPQAQKSCATAAHLPDGNWQVERTRTCRQPGVWTVRVIIPTEGRAPIVLDAPIVIER